MKKQIVFILCLFLTLSVGKVMASTSVAPEIKSEMVSYHFKLGDVSEFSETEFESLLNEVFSGIANTGDFTCTVTLEISVGGVTVSGSVSGPCDEIGAELDKLWGRLYEQAITIAKKFAQKKLLLD